MVSVPRPPAIDDPHPSHVDLLHHADAIQDAALRRHEADLHQNLCRFRTAMAEHLHQEIALHASLPPTTRTVIGEGQRSLVRLVDDLLASGGAQEDCPCISRAAELHHALVAQARLETRSLISGSRSGSTEGPEAS